MLNKKSVALAKTIVSNESVFAHVKNGSILSEAILGSMPKVRMAQPSLESYSDSIEVTASSDNAGVDIHDSAITTAVDAIGPALIRQMSYVRNVAVPLISKITDQLIGKIKGSEPREFLITQYSPSSLALEPYSIELFSKYQSAGLPFRRIKTGPEKSCDEIIDALKTGIAPLDDALAAVIAQDTMAVEDAYNVLFCNGTPTTNTATSKFLENLIKMREDNLYSIEISDVTQVDFAIVVFYILNAYSEDILPGTGMSLVEYRTALNNMKAQLGNQILKSLNWINSSIKSGRLVIRFNRKSDLVFTTEESEIVVFGPVYLQAQAQGVTPESVIGGAIDPKGVQRTLIEQVRNKDINLNRWKMLEVKRSKYSEETFLKRVAENFAVITNQALNDLPDDAFPVGFNRATVCAAISQEAGDIREFFKYWNYTDEPNLWELVKQKICRNVLTFIDTEEIIDVIEEEMMTSGLPPAEAAYSAAIKYLAKWLVANLDICEYKMAEIQGLVSSEILA